MAATDTNIHFLQRFRKDIDIIDKEWEADALSDDELSVAKAEELAMDDFDENEQFDLNNDDEWDDLGLDAFVSSIPSAADTINTNNAADPLPAPSLPQS